MTRRHSTLAVGGLLIGAALASHGIRQRRKLDLQERVALITGGSRGLGLLLARELGSLGAKVVIVAREEAELEQALNDLHAEGIQASIIVADITTAQDATRIVDEVVARYGQLDLLVNNAGVIKVGPVEHMTVADFDEAMSTHFWGPLHTIRAAIPYMRETGGGRIVNISSIGGKIGVPHLVPYCGSKFALTGLSTAIRAELARDNILVTTVCPGLMRTGSPFNAWFKGRYREEFAWFAIADSMPVLSMDGRRAAAQIIEAARCGDAELVVTWAAKLAVAATTLFPNTIAALMDLTNRLLPLPLEHASSGSHSGWQSSSPWAPSVLTRLSEQSAAANNEIPR